MHYTYIVILASFHGLKMFINHINRKTNGTLTNSQNGIYFNNH